MSEASSETIAVPVPPGFIELTGAFGAATILLHHSQVGEVADRRGAHGTPRPTVVRHRTQRRKWEVEQTAAEIRRALTAAVLADRPNAMTLADILLQVGLKRLHGRKPAEGRSC
jgi:hypothetical protein